jgi:hypothetical protein
MEFTMDTIKIDLQTVGFAETPEVVGLVEQELRRVMRFRSDIVASDIYMREEGRNPTDNKVVRWRLGRWFARCERKAPPKISIK